MKKWSVLRSLFFIFFTNNFGMQQRAVTAARRASLKAHKLTSPQTPQVRTLKTTTPTKLENIRDLSGLHSAFKERPQFSPLKAAVYINSGALIKSYRGTPETPTTPAAQAFLNELDGTVRTSIALGNPIRTLDRTNLGAFIAIVTSPDFELEQFLKSDFVKGWHEVHYEQTGRYSKQKDFNQQVKRLVLSLQKAPEQDRDTLLASLLYLKSSTREDLLEASGPLIGFKQLPPRFNITDLDCAHLLLRTLKNPKTISEKELEKIVYLALSQQKGDALDVLKVPFEYAKYKGKSIPPCTEISLRTFIQTILYDPTKKEFSFKNLKNINPLPEFVEFIKKYNDPQKSGFYRNSKDEWLELISSWSNITYLRGETEMAGDMQNSLEMLNILFGTSAKTLSEFAQFISTPKTSITISPGEQPYGSYNTTVNHELIELEGQWTFNSGHVSYNLTPQNSIKLSVRDLFSLGKIGQYFDLNLIDLVSPLKISTALEDYSFIETVKDTKELKALLNYLNINIATFLFEDESNFLHKAILTNRNDLIKGLIEEGINKEQINHIGNTPLISAIKSLNITGVKELLDAGVDPNTSNQYGNTALHIAAANNNQEALKMLINAGVDLNTLDQYGDTVLHLAAANNNQEALKMLINAGVDLNTLDQYGYTALHLAARNNNQEALKILIDAGVDPNTLDQYGYTALHLAARNNNQEALKILIDAGVDLNTLDQYGYTALHMAVNRNSPEALKILIDAGADINIQDYNGKTALHMAVTNGSLEFLKILIDAGADLNAQDSTGKTAREKCFGYYFDGKPYGSPEEELKVYKNMKKMKEMLIEAELKKAET